jgi:hypothetical protein
MLPCAQPMDRREGQVGLAKQNLRIIETPIHYKARTFGGTRSRGFATAGCC